VTRPAQMRRPGSLEAGWVEVRLWPTALLLATASFLVLFDSLAVATALPSIGAEFGLRPGVLQWVVSLYSLSIGAFLVLGGRVCDLWGRRRVLVASLMLCTVAGLLAGLAPGLPLLLTGRVLQGVAAAFAIPAALSTAATVFADEPWRSRVFAVIAFAAWSAGLAGAMLGGWITVHFGWRWVFLVTVPVGAVAVGAAMMLLTRDASRRHGSGRLDIFGAFLVSGGLVTLLFGLDQLGKGGHLGRAVLIVCWGLTLLAVLLVVEHRVADPLVKPRLMRSRRMAGSCLAFGTYCAGYTAVIVVGSLYLQDVRGLSAAAAGFVLAPVLLGGIVSSTFAATILRRYSSRIVVTAALGLCAVSLAVIATRSAGSVGALVPWLVLWGICSGPIYVALTRECIGAAAESDRGTVSALFESMSHIGGGIAVAVYLTLLGAGLAYRSTELVGVLIVAVGAVFAFLILPRHDHDKATP
jgi:EmrB/QacA subfamily drug resistance transporter